MTTSGPCREGPSGSWPCCWIQETSIQKRGVTQCATRTLRAGVPRQVDLLSQQAVDSTRIEAWMFGNVKMFSPDSPGLRVIRDSASGQLRCGDDTPGAQKIHQSNLNNRAKGLTQNRFINSTRRFILSELLYNRPPSTKRFEYFVAKIQ